MTNLLQQLEQQFGVLTAEITNKLLQLQHQNDVDKSKIVNQIEKHIEETHELLEQIDLEIRGISAPERPVHLTHLEGFKKEYDKLRNDFKKAKLSMSDAQTRIELFGDYDDDYSDNRSQLLSDTQLLESSSRKLESGYQLCVESEQVGAEILNNLNSQRETIRRARDRLRTTNYDLGKGSRLANLMIRRSLQAKFTLYAIGLFITLVILYVIYDSLFHK